MDKPTSNKLFIQAIKDKANLKAKSNYKLENVFLDGFKYYDIQGRGLCNLQLFENVLKIRFTLNMFKPQQILENYLYYCKKFGVDERIGFNYRDFIQEITQPVNVNLQQNLSKNEKSKSNSQKIKEYEVQDIIEEILAQGRAKEIGSFIKLYFYLLEKKIKEENDLKNCFTKAGFKLKEFYVVYLIEYFKTEQENFDLKNFLNLLSFNFKNQRKNKVRQMFGRLDFENKKELDFLLLKKIFIMQNFFQYKQELKTLEKIQSEYIESLEFFEKIERSNFLQDRQFITLFSFYSMFIENDEIFENFVDHCFRYNEIKPFNFQKKPETKIEQKIQKNSDQKILEKIVKNLGVKGNRGFLNFYFRMKEKEIKQDHTIYFDDFRKVLESMKCELTYEEIKILFGEYCGAEPRMKTRVFLEDIIKFFNKEKVDQIIKNFNKLKNNNDIDFLKIQNIFNPKCHPDFRNQDKSEYDIKQEFFEYFHKFLIFYQSFSARISQDAFVRFFEMYCQNWEDDTFLYFIENAFDLKYNSNFNHHQNIINRAPFAVDEKPSQSHQFLREEFKNSIRKKELYEIEDSTYSKKNEIQNKREIQQSQRNTETRSLYSKPGENSIRQLNDKIYNNSPPLSQKSNKIDYVPNSEVVQKLRSLIQDSKKFDYLLEYEYQLTVESDSQGFVNFDDLLKTSQLLFGKNLLSEKEIFDIFNIYQENKKLHVQSFINHIRKQLTENQEILTIDLFDKLCGRKNALHLDIKKFKSSFISKNFIFSNKSIQQTQQMFYNMLEIFESLNLSVKQVTYFDIDDFMYFFDNFAFFLPNEKIYSQMLNTCFR